MNAPHESNNKILHGRGRKEGDQEDVGRVGWYMRGCDVLHALYSVDGRGQGIGLETMWVD